MVIPPSLDWGWGWGWGWVRYVHRVFFSSEGEENTNRTQFVTACRVHRKLTATSLDFSKKHRWINTRALLFIYYIIICSFSFSSFFFSSLSSLFSFKLAFFFSLLNTHTQTHMYTHTQKGEKRVAIFSNIVCRSRQGLSKSYKAHDQTLVSVKSPQ